jgi:hypothetical protein
MLSKIGDGGRWSRKSWSKVSWSITEEGMERVGGGKEEIKYELESWNT